MDHSDVTIEGQSASSPRDIAGSAHRIEEEIPSRSYYSSHVHVEPGNNDTLNKCISIKLMHVK
jgi:hypothetical protein